MVGQGTLRCSMRASLARLTAKAGDAKPVGRDPRLMSVQLDKDGFVDGSSFTVKDASPFWKKFRELTTVNPMTNSGLPAVNENRYPAPGTRPERYSMAGTVASDPAANPYYLRDFRRMYPRLAAVSQQDLAKVLLEDPTVHKLEPPSDKNRDTVASMAIEKVENQDPTSVKLSVVLNEAKAPLFSAGRLPPTPGMARRHKWKKVEDAPHNPDHYFPMSLVS